MSEAQPGFCHTFSVESRFVEDLAQLWGRVAGDSRGAAATETLADRISTALAPFQTAERRGRLSAAMLTNLQATEQRLPVPLAGIGVRRDQAARRALTG